MISYLAFVRGHYPEMGFQEFYACLEAEGIEYRLIREDVQQIIFETEANPIPAAERCAFLHSIIQITDMGVIQEDKIKYLGDFPLPEIERNKSFAVRVRKIGIKEIEINSVALERMLSYQVHDRYEPTNLKTNLKHPDYLFLAILQKRSFVLGLEIWSLDRKDYAQREPGERDYFRPGAMKTDFARAIVNLSRVKSGDTFFDPFCGGAGFLLEASELGAFSIGSDLDGLAVLGAKENLLLFKNMNTSIFQGDSRFLAVKEVDAIATDPPYSIQSSTHGEKVSDLILDFLTASRKILKPGGYLVFSSPAINQPEKIVKETDFELVTLIDCIIHKSLTRRTLVLK